MNKLESQNQTVNFDTGYVSHRQLDSDGMEVSLTSGEKVSCKYLIGTDGAGSQVRREIAGILYGDKGL